MLYKKLETISQEEVEQLDKSWDANFFSRTHGYTLKYKNGEVLFKIEYREKLPNDLSENEKSKFTEKYKIIKGNKRKLFIYEYGKIKEEQLLAPSIGFTNDYHVAKPRIFQTKPKVVNITVEELGEFILKNRVLFYTGAGISSEAGVYNMTQLMKALGINHRLLVDSFIKDVLHNPKRVKEIFRDFCDSAFRNRPTKAHKSLTELAILLSTNIFTENFDFLHERTGIKAYHTEGGTLKNDFNKKWFHEINAVFCIGLSYDDRGFLSWYKNNNSNGKIISIDLLQPGYLGEKDYFINGDFQHILPELESIIKSKIR